MTSVAGKRVAVVGGGVSGLVAAYELRRLHGDGVSVDVFEATGQPGGLLATRTVGGVAVDVGAEAFIVRRREALELVRELGLGGEIVAPGQLRPAIYSQGRLHELPRPALMGIPATPDAVSALAADDDLARMAGEETRPFHWDPAADVSVGELVGDRFGQSVVTRSVDPMLGGVFSALAGDLGVREAIPGLAARLDGGASSLTAAVRDLTQAAGSGGGPVFGALRGGYRRLVEVLTRASGANVRTGEAVTAVSGADGRFGVTTADGGYEYDAVIVAVPAWTAGSLLTDVAPQAAAALSAVRPAGSAVVACALAPGAAVPANSGILVATDADLPIKAVTLSSQKWPHLAGGADRPATLRVSFGRLGEPVTAGDASLIAAARESLGTLFGAAGMPAPEVADAVVQRWPEGLPHYGPGQLSRMAVALESLPPGIAVAGSAYAGVGVPACIGTARAAAVEVSGTMES